MVKRKNTTAPIKNITFDVGNVLIHWDPRLAFEPLFKDRKEELDYFLNEICTLAWHTKHDQGMSFEENIRALQKQYPDYAPMIAAFDTEWDNMFGEVMGGTVQIMYQLHALGYPLYALTNFSAEKFTNFTRKHDFMSLFQDIVMSGEEKIVKPDPRIYQILLQRNGILAENTLFIDDREENTKAAELLGFQTLVFTTAEQLKTDLIELGLLPA